MPGARSWFLITIPRAPPGLAILYDPALPQDPDILVDLTTAASEFEAGVMVEALKGQGIPAQAFTAVGSTMQWEIAMTQPFRVAVRRADLERAREALRAIKADSVDLDWDEVNTGESTPEDESGAPGWARTVRWVIIALGAGALLVLLAYLVRIGAINPNPPH
jgi:hypothetical protein